MEGLLGVVGTGAILFLTAFAYIIWQFNPTFKWPVRKPTEEAAGDDTAPALEESIENEEQNQFVPLTAGQTLNDLYAAGVRPNQLKEESRCFKSRNS